MERELLGELEKRLGKLLDDYSVLKRQNELLNQENERLRANGSMIRDRLDSLIKRIEGI